VSLISLCDKLYWIQDYVIKFVIDMRQVSSIYNIYSYNITEILLKVELILHEHNLCKIYFCIPHING
jgi:hypothetical protein